MFIGEYSIYKGRTFSSGLLKNGNIILRAADSVPYDLDFKPCAPFILPTTNENIVALKEVDANSISERFLIKIFAKWNGYLFQVTNENDNMICIFSMDSEGNYSDWENLGMVQVDKGVYKKWICKDDAEIEEIKENLPTKIVCTKSAFGNKIKRLFDKGN